MADLIKPSAMVTQALVDRQQGTYVALLVLPIIIDKALI